MHSRLVALVDEMVTKGVYFPDALREFERCFILKVMERHHGSISRAAEALGMHRNTLASRLKDYRRARAKAAGSAG